MATQEIDEEKRAAGYAAVDRFVRREMRCIGLGTGSTAYWAIDRVGARIAEGWELVAVTTSVETDRLCSEHGIRTIGLCEGPRIEVAIDGADEVAPDFSLTKGGGGALFREKAVALAAESFVVIVGANKLVSKLGAFPLPVEVVPFTTRYVERELRKLAPVAQRMKGGAPFVTDNGNHILDCRFGEITAPAELDRTIREINGVVATGLFVGLASHVLVGSPTGVSELERR